MMARKSFAKNVRIPDYELKITNGSLHVPINEDYKVYDVSGRIVNPHHCKPGIFFIEVNGRVINIVVKIK